jgi:hypothetical protein
MVLEYAPTEDVLRRRQLQRIELRLPRCKRPDDSGPGIASEFGIRYLPKLLRADRSFDQVVLYARVSEHEQDRNGSLYRQIANLLTEVVLTHDLKVAGLYSTVASGWLWKNDKRDAAFRHASRLGIPLVAETVPRLLRSIAYQSNLNTDAWPTVDEFTRFRKMIGKVKTATLLEPDAIPHDIRSYEKERGRRFMPAGEGRSDKTFRKAAFSTLARQLVDRDYSYTTLAVWFGVNTSTIQYWVR